MADRQAEIILFNREAPAPKAPRPTAQIVAIPTLSYRGLGKNLDAAAMARRLVVHLRVGDDANDAKAVALWRSHVARLKRGAAAAFSLDEVGRMVAAYSRAVRAEIDKLKVSK
jgi:hypothetical protein